MWRVAVVVTMVAMLAILFGPGAALGEEGCEVEEIHVHFEGNVFGTEGDVVEVARISVDPHLIGATCTGTATVHNNSSAHDGNDFIISSGGSTVVIPDFEGVAGGVTTSTSGLVLGETLIASIRLGKDGVASLAGDTVVIASICEPVQATTTTSTTAVVPPAPTTSATPPPTNRTIETPIGGVDAGGGGSAPDSGVGVAILSVGVMALAGALGVAAHSCTVTRR
jgi:hypothetical protein